MAYISKIKLPSGATYSLRAGLRFTGLSVATSAWASNTTYSSYPYRASVTCSGVTANEFADVVFSPTDAASGILAPVATTAENVVYIYASEKPSSAVSILSIKCD